MQSIKEHFKKTLTLAYPVIIGQLGFMMMNVADSLMVGRIGASPLAAASLGTSLSLIIFMVGLGVSISVTPLVAIALGAKKFELCGIYFRQSFLVNFVLSLITASITYICADLIKYFNQPPDVAGLAASYTKILALSTIPMMFFQTYKQFIEGLSIMRPAMFVAIAANAVNIFCNWMLIYGNLGAPALGLDGAGIATFFSRIFMMAALMLYVMNNKYFKQFDVSFHFKKINFPIIKKILSIGLPSGFQYLFEVGAFSSAVIMVGWLGTKPLAAHQIAINLASISFMGVLGISAAGGIRVGNAVGKQDISEVRKSGFTALILAVIVEIFTAAIFIIFKNYLPSLYINDGEVISIAASLLIIAGIFQISDGIQAVGIGILRGLTDVKIPTLITFIAYWIIALPVGYLLGFIFHLGVQGIWIGLLIGLTVSASLLTLRFNRRSKQKILV